MSTNVIACPSCGFLSNLEVAGPICWKCGRQFAEQDFADRESRENSQSAIVLPVAAPAMHAPNTGAVETIGGILGVSVVLVPLIFLLSWCTSDPPPPSAAEMTKQAAEAAEARLYGTHCLSGWDGSHSGTVQSVKATLRDPSSFEHIETRTSPMDERGKHILTMQFRATNGFGGPSVGFTSGTLDSSTCQVKIDQIDG